MLETVGDLTWHYHAGIMTLPFRVAVEKNIPLVEVEKLTNVLIDNKIVRRKEIIDAEYQLFPAITESKLIELIEIGFADTTFSPEDLSNLNSIRTLINTR